ncbi:MAG: glycosyltransferase [Flavobacteriaceae bacterium]|nr:glycosyltransferase [Flavobacteriaceae bacterium]
MLPPDIEGRKIFIYQGAVNMGRGLELMIDALPFINHAIFLIVGDGDIKKQLISKVRKAGLDEKVKFLGMVSTEELRNITAQASLGVSLEEDLGLNYRYALPNKLYDYIQAKIPVLVSDLPDMKALVESYDVGIVLKERTPANVAKSIQEILENKSSMVAQLQKAADEFVWEEESKKLKNLFNDLK